MVHIEFIIWFHEFSVTTNLPIFQEHEFVYLFLCTNNVSNEFIFSEKIRRFVLSDEFDNSAQLTIESRKAKAHS